MKVEKLVAKLQSYLTSSRKRNRMKRDQIEKLLRKLKDKEESLEKDLAKEKDEKKAKRLKTEFKIVKAQRAKGLKLLEDLKGRC